MPLSEEFLKYLAEANISEQEYHAASIADRTATLNKFRSSQQMTTQGKVARIQTDCSQKSVQAVCVPFDSNVLNDKNLLLNALLSSLITKIPVDRLCIPGSGLNVDTVFVRSDNGEEATMLVDRFVAFEHRCAELRVGMSEESVLLCITEITGMMWRRMASLLKISPVFKVLYNNKKDLTGATEGDGRPDETDYLNDFMVCKSEHNDEDLQKAIAELTKKLSRYNHIEYGLKIVFLPVIAAAGSYVEFGFVDVRTKAYHCVIRYDLLDVCQRPTRHPCSKTIRNITYYDSHVLKKLSTSSTCPEELYELLERGSVPGAITATKKRGRTCKQPSRSCYNAWPSFTQEASFTGRTSATLESSNFLVIDFEFAAVDGDFMLVGDYVHRDMVPYGSRYYAANDLQLVGKLVETWTDSNGHELDASARDFVRFVTKMKEPLDANAALQHIWLQE
eukprot:gene36282-47219_t